jgi:flavin reductase (DIM6/NTAB) family NADH-FMN oxidoreductase RutF
MIDAIEFRRVMGHFASGVGIVTTLDADRRPCGLTVNAICSVSLDPVIVLVCVERAADSHECLRASGIFAINVLPAEGGEGLALRFSTWGVKDKFAGIAYGAEQTGAPVLTGSLAWLDCEVVEELKGGDHTIFLGRVVAADADDGVPLVYYRGGYGRYHP